MLPEIKLHRPSGLTPSVSVRKRTVVDYEPSWLLLAVPVLGVLAARRKRSGTSAGQEETAAVDTRTSASTRTSTTDSTPDSAQPRPRRRPARVLLVAMTRVRRPGARQGTGEDVVVAVAPVPVNGQPATV